MKQALLLVHKWLGVALALLFLVWFASGIVLYFVPFPSLTPTERLAGLPLLVLEDLKAERLAGLPALALDDRPAEQLAGLPATAVDNRCCLTAPAATARAGLRAVEARLGMHADMPVWRLLRTAPDKRWIAVDASTGALLPDLSTAQAMAVAEAFSGRRAIYAEALERDQWTVAQGFNPYRPLVRVELDGNDGLELYVSPGAAEVVGETRRAERAWNWVGAIPHWIYFTELRRWPERWHNVVVWLSLPGVLLAATGLIIGVWQLFLNRSRWIPYRVFWMRWHHILGLAVGMVTLTWIFSGLMSMNPFSVFSPRGARADEQRRWSGQEVVAQLSPAAALRLAAPLQVRELETLRFNGQAWYRLRGVDGSVLVRADSFAAEGSVAAADGAAAAGGITAADDVDGTAATASHAAVIAALPDADMLARPRLRDSLVVLLSLLGVAMSVTACVVAWRVFVPRKRRR